MRGRTLLPALAVALLVAACGAGASSGGAGGASTTVAGPEDTRPVAPDFTLALADGTTFRLYGEARPVYLVFWAEW